MMRPTRSGYAKWLKMSVACYIMCFHYFFFFFFGEFMCFHLWASTPARVNLCKIQKVTNFTHFTPKIFHISPSKVVQIYTFATVTMHRCMVTVARVYHILLISCFAPFFSLFFMQNKLTSLLNPHHLFPQIHTNTNTPTHKHKHTEKSSQRVPRLGLVSRTTSSSWVAELRGGVWLDGSGLWVFEGWCGFWVQV